jgi:integral membrane sensor domain MASE1
MIGGLMFTHLGHRVWPVLMLGSVVAVVFALAGVRTPARPASPEQLPVELPVVEVAVVDAAVVDAAVAELPAG